MRNHERQYTRREIILSMSAAVPLVGGWSTVVGHDLYKKILDTDPNLHNNFPNISEKVFPAEAGFSPVKEKTTKDPVFCASTVQWVRGNGWYGHGSVMDVKGEYHIYTIGHVAEVFGDSGNYLHMPGVGTTQVQLERIVQTQKAKKKEEEQAAYYVLGATLQNEIKSAVNEGRVFPLTHRFSLPEKGEEVLIPSEEKGDYQRFRYVRYNSSDNLMHLESTSPDVGENCQGDSGSPILRLVKDGQGSEFLTGETYGVLQGSSKLYPVSDTKHCATYFAARPNN